MQTSNQLQKPERITPDKLEIALQRSSLGLDVGARLRDAARAVGDSQALADSYLISESARIENYFITPHMVGEFGEDYEGLFTLTTLSTSRLCPNYVADRAHASRKIVKERVRGTSRRVGLSHKLATLTKPKLIGAGIELDFKVFDDALVRLRKSKWWTDRVVAAVKGEEVTLGDKKRLEKEKRRWDFVTDGYHVHAHILVYGKHLDWEELGGEWKKWLMKAAKKYDVTLEFNTKHGRPVVDVQKIEARERDDRDISEEAAVFEVCKYVVKGSEFARVPASQLIDVDRALRGRRMLEFWGEYNNRKGSKKRGADESREAANAYLDEKKQLTAKSDSKKLQKPRKPRSRSLRESGAELCAQKWVASPRKRRGEEGEDEWVEWTAIEKGEVVWASMVEEVGRQRRDWRKSDLISRFPFNIFYRIDSKEVLYGMSVNPASAFESDEQRTLRTDFKFDLGERLEQVTEDRAAELMKWDEVSGHVDRADMHMRVAWQERERFIRYIEHGVDALVGDETLENRKAMDWAKFQQENTTEENRDKIARAYQLELSGEIAGMSQSEITEYFRPRVEEARRKLLLENGMAII